MSMRSYDVVIVGGGVMGSSTAYHLTKADPGLKVAVLEKDPTYEFSSSTLSMANIRIQFSLKENIEISLHALEVFESFGPEMAVEGEEPDIAFRQEGNLFLYDRDGAQKAAQAHELQKSLGCAIEQWPLEKISRVYKLYSPGPDIVSAYYGPRDGHLDAYAVVMGFRAKARYQGAQFLKAEATRVITGAGGVRGVETADGGTYAAQTVINCAGAWCSQLAETAGVKLPVEPVKRQIYALDVAVKPDVPLPLTILPSGMYFRTELGDLILLGKSLEDDEVGFSFSYDRQRFIDRMWMELAEFVPAWERLKIVRGWGGLYAENRLDGNAILGEWPELKGFYLANGFSGHGLQQGPAVGRYLAELILGKKPGLDLSIFSPRRILENRPIPEMGLV